MIRRLVTPKTICLRAVIKQLRTQVSDEDKRAACNEFTMTSKELSRYMDGDGTDEELTESIIAFFGCRFIINNDRANEHTAKCRTDDVARLPARRDTGAYRARRIGERTATRREYAYHF